MAFERLNRLFFPHDHKATHFKALDGLRGIAVLIVLLSHSSNANIFIHERLNFHGVGTIGVYLFFVLSAYLLDSQIVSAFVHQKASKQYWTNYFIRRFLRIYPLFIIALSSQFLLSLMGFNSAIDHIKDFLLHLLLLKGESIFWSIPVEFKYYFISPLLLWVCHKYLRWNRIQLIVLFSLIILVSIGMVNYVHYSRISTLKFFPIFMVGTMLSIWEYTDKNQIEIKEHTRLFNYLGWIAFLFIFIFTRVDFKKIFGFEIKFLSPTFYFPYACVWGMLLLSAKYGNGLVRRMLELKPLRFIGSISFSLYLFHLPFISLVRRIDIPSELQFYVFFGLTLLFSSLTYLLIERPLSKIKIKSVVANTSSNSKASLRKV